MKNKLFKLAICLLSIYPCFNTIARDGGPGTKPVLQPYSMQPVTVLANEISIDLGFNADYGLVTLVLTNSEGLALYSQQENTTFFKEHSINSSELESGVYTLTIYDSIGGIITVENISIF